MRYYLSYLINYMSQGIDDETCDCEQCLNSDNPCSHDCDADLCPGCLERKLDSDDMAYDQDFAMGRLGGKNIGELK